MDTGLDTDGGSQALTDHLVLWLDANDPTTIVTKDGGIAGWKDRSGNGHDMTAQYATGVDGQDAGAPSIAPIRLEQLDGHAVMAFRHEIISRNSWVSPELTTGGAFVDETVGVSSPDWLIVVVGAERNTDARQGLFLRAFSGSTPPFYGPCLLAGAKASGTDRFAIDVQGPWNDGALHVFTFGIDGTHHHAWLRVDGKTVSIELAARATDWFSTISIGGHLQHVCTAAGEGCLQYGTTIDDALNGAIAEILVFKDTAGTALELAKIDTYVSKKYGLHP
jgi:hypothetical protein